MSCMKPFVFMILLLAVTGLTIAQARTEIDQVRTVDDAVKIVKRQKALEYFSVKTTLEFDSAECNALVKDVPGVWQKADLDGDGFNDLLVYGDDGDPRVVVILDRGARYEVKYLSRQSFQKCAVATILDIAGKKIVRYRALDNDPKDLVFAFGDFVEYNEKPPSYRIEKIDYKTSGCFGTCPIFKITIKRTGEAVYHAIQFNPKDGKFSGKVRQSELEDVIRLLNYIDFPTLQDKYSVNWTDDQSSSLTITYDGGKVKTINDYGMLGTFGLSRANDLLFDLRLTISPK